MPEAPPRSKKRSDPVEPEEGGVSHAAATAPPLEGPTNRPFSESEEAAEALAGQRERMEKILRDDPELAFHVGTLPDCPRWNLDLAGVNFPRSTERVEVRGGETIRTPMAGAVIRITASKQKEVLKAIAGRVVRFRRTAAEENTPGMDGDLVRDGRGMPPEAQAAAMPTWTGTVIVMDANPQRPYRPQRGDRPLADFVYMERRPDLDAAKPSYPKPLSAAAATS